MKPINLQKALESLSLLQARTPYSTPEEKATAFLNLTNYRDGAIYIGYFNGESDWERHTNGDEIVWILEGTTTLVRILDGIEVSHTLTQHEFVIVPKDTWHKFKTVGPVKSLTITPAPSDHRIEDPT